MKKSDNLKFFIPFEKVDIEKRRVYGVITAEQWDEQNDLIDFEATKKAFEEYKKWRNVREMHQPSAVGTMPVIEIDEVNKKVSGEAYVVDDRAWQKVKEGVYKGYSVGGKITDYKIEINPNTGQAGRRITGYKINEISLVDRPALPVAVFSLVKVAGEERSGIEEEIEALGEGGKKMFEKEKEEHPTLSEEIILQIVKDHLATEEEKMKEKKEEQRGDPEIWKKAIDTWDEWAGSFTECVRKLEGKEGITSPERLCAWMHYQAEGKWPAEKEELKGIREEDIKEDLEAFTKLDLEELKKEGKEIPEEELSEKNIEKVVFPSVIEAVDVLVKYMKNPEKYVIISETESPEEEGMVYVKKADIEEGEGRWITLPDGRRIFIRNKEGGFEAKEVKQWTKKDYADALKKKNEMRRQLDRLVSVADVWIREGVSDAGRWKKLTEKKNDLFKDYLNLYSKIHDYRRKLQREKEGFKFSKSEILRKGEEEEIEDIDIEEEKEEIEELKRKFEEIERKYKELIREKG